MSETTTTKQCPFCAETIQAAAVVCRYCGRDLAAPSKAAPHRVQAGATWKCSECGGFIRSDAPHCKHCKAVFGGAGTAPAAMASTPKAPASPRLAIILSVIVAVVMGTVLFFGGSGRSNTPRAPDRVSAWVDCRSFVEQNLKSPSTAEFPLSNAAGVTIDHLSNGRWSVLGFVDAENAFGAMLRQDFGCQISYSGTRVTLHQLRIGDKVLLDS